jgi:hypothetical protein
LVHLIVVGSWGYLAEPVPSDRYGDSIEEDAERDEREPVGGQEGSDTGGTDQRREIGDVVSAASNHPGRGRTHPRRSSNRRRALNVAMAKLAQDRDLSA